MLIILAILLAATVVAAAALSSGIVKPLSRLTLAMRQIQKGDFARAEKIARPVSRSKSEVGFAANSFLTMVGQLQEHIKLEFEMNLRRQDAEYKALLMQINPHFLYNTLEVISSLTLQKRSRDAVRVIESLGRMLRFSLDTRRDEIALGEEIKYIEHYVSILRMRFSDRLQIEVDADPAVIPRPVLKFVLQPIVENAVKYSAGSQESAVVAIRCREDPETDGIILEVEDNGCGMPETAVKEIAWDIRRTQGTGVLDAPGRRIGLRNVLARCSLYYGEAFSAAIESRVGEGTRIILKLPGRRLEDGSVSRADRG
nr:sensor histidine kinase [Cohnella sp. CFH 77786]